MVKTLVVPLDGSPETERAAPIAAALARQWRAETLLVAVSPLPEHARRDLEQLMWRDGFEGRVEAIDQDDVAAALRSVVEQAPEPAVCMATHSRGRVSVALLGSVTERLLREVHVPFVLVGPHCATGWPTARGAWLRASTSRPRLRPSSIPQPSGRSAWASSCG